VSERLLPQVVHADEAVDIDALYRLHARTVARWALRLGGPQIDAEDVMQEVFVVAKRRLRTFEARARITTWLFRTTEKVVRATRRRTRLRRLLALPDPPEDRTADTRPDPLETALRDETCRRVYRILDRLPDRHRRVLILFELEGLATQEISDLLEIKAATVRVWLHRARARFAQLDEELSGEPAWPLRREGTRRCR
jgi:RNA polymerase sigma factor (sigma-70 family)